MDIGMGRAIYHIKDLSVVKIFKKLVLKLKFLSTFFGRMNRLCSELLQITMKTLFLPNFLASSKFLKKNVPKKAFLRNFWKMFTNFDRFLARALPANLIYIGAKGALRKNGYHKILSRGNPLDRQGIESLGRGYLLAYLCLVYPVNC